MTRPFRIRSLSAEEAQIAATALGEVLFDCVAGGASVGFMADFTRQDATVFWLDQTHCRDGRAILVAEDDAGVFGVVQVIPVATPNQPHRVDVSKMLVHRRGRRRGAAEALMVAAEDAAREMGRWLMVLDTVTGSPADFLYEKRGWSRAGVIPDYALMPDGALCDATFFYKALDR